MKGTEKYISIKSVQQEVVPRPQLHVLRRRVKLHFYYKKEEGGKKKCESYEVEIKTSHTYFILMNLTEPINCTAVVFFCFFLLR